MLKRLMLALILGMIMSGPASPMLKSFLGIGSSTAYAAEDPGTQGDEDQDDSDFGGDQ